MLFPRRFFPFFVLCSVAGVAADLPNTEQGNPSPISPEQALAGVRLPSGFTASLWANEPAVQNPVGVTWDKRGRMWVAENYTYAEKGKRFDLSLQDRVVILEDDGTGKAGKRTVFAEAQMLTSVEIGEGGVWLMCPPRLLFVPDANGDDIPDSEPRVVLDGFTVAQANYHNFANGLRWGPDGWLYGRCGASCPGEAGVPGVPAEQRIPLRGGIWRYHPGTKVFEALTHGTTNPWGHDWNEHGDLFFINTVNGHLWHGIHGAHFVRPHTLDPNPHAFTAIDQHADHWHFDTGKGWTASRDGSASDLGGGHAHSGMMIYRGTQWPKEYWGRLFTLNFHGRRANVERLERHGSGYIGKHEPDVFHWADPWFRGVEIRTGPDGAAYVLDWSDTGECHENTGVHRTSGRIYRIAHQGALPDPVPARQTIPDGLVHEDENVRAGAIRRITDGWSLDTVFSKRPTPDRTGIAEVEAVLPTLIQLARTDLSGLVRLQLASTLQRLPHPSRADLAAALVSRVEDASDHNLPAMVWYGLIPLADADPAGLLRVAQATRWPDTLRWITRRLALGSGEAPAPFSDLLAAAGGQSPELQSAVLLGASEGFQGWRKAPLPAAWAAFTAAALPQLSDEGKARIRDLSTLFGDGRALEEVRRIALDKAVELPQRLTALRTLIESRPPDLRTICESLVRTPDLGSAALRGLAAFDDPALGERLAGEYRHLYKDRPALVETLASRPAWARALLAEITAGRIPRADLSAFHARQIRGFNDPALTTLLGTAWGEARESSSDKVLAIAALRAELNPAHLAAADQPRGRAVFQTLCAACHTLYGSGGKLGPDLTGGGRENLDYLLENIVDPSAVVTADFRLTTLTLKDGRTLSGMVAARTGRTLTLQTAADAQTVERAEVAQEEQSAQSLMPEGLLAVLTTKQRRDLFAYLMNPTQVALPPQARP